MIAVSLGHLVASYGYFAVFGAVALESCGLPVPGETTLVAAAVYAGATHRLSLVPIVLVAMLAAVVGDNIGYLIGRSFGERLLLRIGRGLRVESIKLESKLLVARYLFFRHGGKVVFLGRFVTILRTYAALLAGVGNMAWRRFVFYNVGGALIWAVAFAVGGYELGGIMTRVSEVIAIILGATAAVLVVLGYFGLRRFGAQLQARAEAATLQSSP